MKMHSMNNKGFALSGLSIVFVIIGVILIAMAITTMYKNKDTKKLYDVIKEKAVLDNISSDYVTSENGINFTEEASDTNGKGIYLKNETEKEEYPIYYYRGNVDNNNVLFAGFCWKIVRTTDTGGIKLIYNGKSKDGVCSNTKTDSQIGIQSFNSRSDDNTYVGYMYGKTKANDYKSAHENTNDSKIKEEIDKWYKENIEDKKFSKYIEDTIWCNDRTTTFEDSGFGDTITFYEPGTKILLKDAQKISLTCPNKNDSFTVSEEIGNGALKYPVALLTIDEVVLSGYAMGGVGIDTNNFLNSGESWWTLSPYSYAGGAVSQYVEAHNKISSIYGFIQYGVRPSISLKSDVSVKQGDGTEKNPYVI